MGINIGRAIKNAFKSPMKAITKGFTKGFDSVFGFLRKLISGCVRYCDNNVLDSGTFCKFIVLSFVF